MSTNCKHCYLSCKVKGKTECDKYQSISSRPEQLKIEIREAFKIGNYEKGRKLQDILFRMNCG